MSSSLAPSKVLIQYRQESGSEISVPPPVASGHLLNILIPGLCLKLTESESSEPENQNFLNQRRNRLGNQRSDTHPAPPPISIGPTLPLVPIPSGPPLLGPAPPGPGPAHSFLSLAWPGSALLAKPDVWPLWLPGNTGLRSLTPWGSTWRWGHGAFLHSCWCSWTAGSPWAPKLGPPWR